MSRNQRGHVYEEFSAFHVQYYQTELRDDSTSLSGIRTGCGRQGSSPLLVAPAQVNDDAERLQEGHHAGGVQGGMKLLEQSIE
jgi:hypothetical protein